MRRPWPAGGCFAWGGGNKTTFFLNTFLIKNFEGKSCAVYCMSVIAHALAYYGCLLLRFVYFCSEKIMILHAVIHEEMSYTHKEKCN
jgi:hypothetical protein